MYQEECKEFKEHDFQPNMNNGDVSCVKCGFPNHFEIGKFRKDYKWQSPL